MAFLVRPSGFWKAPGMHAAHIHTGRQSISIHLIKINKPFLKVAGGENKIFIQENDRTVEEKIAVLSLLIIAPF